MSRQGAIKWYTEHLTKAASKGEVHYREAKRWLGRNDLFYLLVALLNRKDVNRDWLFDRCREVQAEPDGFIDLWAREHYKSTIITFGLTIQDILNDPNETFGIFSHSRPIAKAFLRQIKQEFEMNRDLQELYSDVLFADPKNQALKWSEDEGIVVKRTSNPKEATVEAWGLVDGMPTSKHFGVLLYDDTVTDKSVTSADMTKKTTDAFRLSSNLGKHGGRRRIIGTRYSFADTNHAIIEDGIAVPRVYPATIDGTMDGEPVLLTPEDLASKLRDMGSYIFGCQMLQDPKADSTMGFKEEHIRRWGGVHTDNLVKIIIVDPAGEQKKDSDYTAIWVLGYGADENWYQIEFVYDKLNLSGRTAELFKLHRAHKPIFVGYEKYGKDSDIEHIESEQERAVYRFDITPLGGSLKKEDRIRRLVPLFENGRIYLLDREVKTDWQGRTVDVVRQFINEEYKAFPLGGHDDGLDSLSRICDEVVKQAVEGAIPSVPSPQQEREAAAQRLLDEYAEPGSTDAWLTA
mgnify:CR=1 FL=1